MRRTTIRARVAIGSAVMAVAGFAAAGQLSASPESAPPSTPPASEPGTDTAVEGSLATPTPSEPVGSAPALDPEREELVDIVVTSAESAGFPLDRDCVAGLVAQLPDADVPLLADQIAEDAAATEGAVAETLVVETAPTLDTSGGDPYATEPVDTAVVDTAIDESVPMGSEPAMSPAVEELGSQIINCAAGDADPALVADALAVIEADPEAPMFDLACVESVLSTFDDETLQLIIDEAAVVPTETAAGASVSVEPVPADTSVAGTDAVGTETVGTDLAITSPEISIPEISIPDEEAFGEAMILLACSPEFMDESTAVDSGSAPPSPDTANATIPAVSEPTETTVG